MDSTELLRHVATVIRTKPETFNMSQWMEHYETGAEPCSVSEMLDLMDEKPWDCETVGCIAGHSIVADPDRSRELAKCFGDREIETIGAKLLGLSRGAGLRLFYAGSETNETLAQVLDRLAEIEPTERVRLDGGDMRDLLDEADANA